MMSFLFLLPFIISSIFIVKYGIKINREHCNSIKELTRNLLEILNER